ncbi:Uncharacterised protein [Bordetella pertussis]|nr:Uncharacterised protein [Bordetella pertussis]CFW37261.1 Uncharacterised protein [Bordetella pertussis]
MFSSVRSPSQTWPVSSTTPPAGRVLSQRRCEYSSQTHQTMPPMAMMPMK